MASAQFAGPATESPGEQNEFHSTFGAHMQNTRNIYYNIIRERETWLTCQDQQSFDSSWETVWLGPAHCAFVGKYHRLETLTDHSRRGAPRTSHDDLPDDAAAGRAVALRRVVAALQLAVVAVQGDALLPALLPQLRGDIVPGVGVRQPGDIPVRRV